MLYKIKNRTYRYSRGRLNDTYPLINKPKNPWGHFVVLLYSVTSPSQITYYFWNQKRLDKHGRKGKRTILTFIKEVTHRTCWPYKSLQRTQEVRVLKFKTMKWFNLKRSGWRKGTSLLCTSCNLLVFKWNYQKITNRRSLRNEEIHLLGERTTFLMKGSSGFWT